MMNKWYIKFLTKIASYLVTEKFCLTYPEKLRFLFNKFKKTGYLVDFSSWDIKETFLKTSALFPPVKLQFEDKYFNVPNDYDYCLRTRYGSYMELPPVEQQAGHMPDYIVFDTTAEEKKPET